MAVKRATRASSVRVAARERSASIREVMSSTMTASMGPSSAMAGMREAETLAHRWPPPRRS